MVLDPQVKALLEESKKEITPPMSTLSPNKARLTTNYESMAGDPEEVGEVVDRRIPGPNGEIPVRIYTPKGKGAFPALIYYHGGGWVLGDLESVDVPCRLIVNRADCVVVSVDYRLAPEHKFPAAVEDAYSAAKWLAKNAESVNVDSSRIAVGGDSAGGNLAAVVALMARDKGDLSIIYQMLIYPVTDYSFKTDSYTKNAEGYLLTKEDMIWYWNHYLRHEDDGKNPYASPLQAENLSGLPPALVQTAEFDPLRDEGEHYAERLKESGVFVEAKRYNGMIHGYFWMSGVLDQGKECIEQAANSLKLIFHQERK